MPETVDIQNTEHYMWGNACDGWHFLKRDDVSVILERVPPGESEVQHYHNQSRQFFFILEGQATIDVEGTLVKLDRHQGLEIAPRAVHQFKNDSLSEVFFLIVSFPKSHGDRVIVEGDAR